MKINYTTTPTCWAKHGGGGLVRIFPNPLEDNTVTNISPRNCLLKCNGLTRLRWARINLRPKTGPLANYGKALAKSN